MAWDAPVGAWHLQRQIGGGSFCRVLLWRNRSTSVEIVTKTLADHQNKLLEDEVKKVRERWQQEHECLRALAVGSVPDIVHNAPPFDSDFKQSLNARHIWQPLPVLFVEYCNAGNMRRELSQPAHVNGLPEFQVRAVLGALQRAIVYLHYKCNVCHRDLRPESILLHRLPDGRRIYKLADHGLARRPLEQAMQRSIARQRPYFAPELVETASNDKCLDYWSLGIIAYELCTGTLPFLPHQSVREIVLSVRQKPYDCIAIVEMEASRYDHLTTLPETQQLTAPFRDLLVPWLQLALDIEPKTRGERLPPAHDNVFGSQPAIFTMLEGMLASQILTIYCLNTRQLLAYAITPDMQLQDLKQLLAKDTALPEKTMCFVLPAGHPCRHSSEKRPSELYVEEWQDTSQPCTPHVMAYVVNAQCAFQSSVEPIITDTIRYFMSPEADQAQNWQLKQYAHDVHFLLGNEQRQLETYLRGLQDYAMVVERMILDYGATIEAVQESSFMLKGMLKYISFMLEVSALTDTTTFTMTKLTSELTLIETAVSTIVEHYNSTKRHINKAVNCQLGEAYIQKDVYGLADFRKELQNTKATPDQRREYCVQAIYNFANKRHAFLTDLEVHRWRVAISDMHTLYKGCEEAVQTALERMRALENQIQQCTRAFLAEHSSQAATDSTMSTSAGSSASSSTTNDDDGR